MILGGIIRRYIWIAVGIMGTVAGFFFGIFIHSIIVAATSHEHAWEMVALAIFFAILGGVLSFKWGKEIVILSTSFIGSYLFMRGFTFIFDGYPNEGQMWNDITEGNEIHVS